MCCENCGEQISSSAVTAEERPRVVSASSTGAYIQPAGKQHIYCSIQCYISDPKRAGW